MSSPAVQFDPGSFVPTAKPAPPVSFDANTFQPHGGAAAPPAPAAPKTGMQKVNDALTGANETDPSWQSPELGGMLSGALKSASGLAGNVMDFLSKPSPIGGNQPSVKPDTPLQAKVHGHMQDAAAWLKSGGQPQGFWENVGAAGEQILEYLGTDGLLKLVGPASAAIETGEHLKQAQQVAQVVAKNPKLAGLLAVGMKASKDALMLGGQTYAHTEDPTQAVIAGAGGGVLRVAGEGVSALGARILKNAPKTLHVAGEDIPALASQVNEAGKPIPTGADGAPAIAAAQQQGAQNVIRTTAQQGTKDALERLNATRPVFPAQQGTDRLLPAPEGTEPFTFSLEGPTPTQSTTGKMAQSAAKVPQAAFKDPRFTTSSAPTREPIRPGGPTATEGEMGHDISTARTPGAMADVAKGGGALKTTDPQEAQAWLQHLEDIKASTAFDSLPEAQQGRIEAQRKALEEQLGLYHASPYAQRFSPIDAEGAASKVHTFGDMGAQIQAAVQPVYQKLDQLSGGDFNKYKKGVTEALGVIRNKASMEATDAAELRLAENNDAINNLITRHMGDISQSDYQAARSGWRDSMVANKLHAVTERMMNGVTVADADEGFTRVMTGNTKALQNWLGKASNQADAERLIGREGVTNLKQMTELLGRVGTARATRTAAQKVWEVIGPHARMGGIGGLAGGLVASHMGVPWFDGMVAGAGVGEGIKAVMRDAVTNPRIGNMVAFAVRNNLSPKIYAPLIARAIATPMQEQAQPQQQAGGNQ